MNDATAPTGEGEGKPVAGGACPNCGQVGQGRYCSSCGRTRRTRAGPVRELLPHVASEVLDLERRFFRTLLPLLTRPGFLTREYRDGRGGRYTHPLRTYLLVSAAYFTASLLFGSRFAEPGAVVSDVPASWIMFGAVPVFAAALFVGYHVRGRPYMEYLFFAFHFQAAFFLVLLGTRLLPWPTGRTVVPALYAVFYLAWGSTHLWGEGGLKAWLRAPVALLLYGLVLLVAFGLWTLLFVSG